MLNFEITELSKQQNWTLNTIKEWLQWKGLYLFCAPSLLHELSQETHFSPHTATGVISDIENYFASQPRQWRCSTKPPEQYKGKPLKGLWKAHLPFRDWNTMMQNLSNEFDQPWMSRKLEKMIGPSGTPPLDDQQCRKIAWLASVKSLENRSMRRAMTGHWLVFSRVEDRNYYLTLARHKESDETVFARAKIAAYIYPKINLLATS